MVVTPMWAKREEELCHLEVRVDRGQGRGRAHQGPDPGRVLVRALVHVQGQDPDPGHDLEVDPDQDLGQDPDLVLDGLEVDPQEAQEADLALVQRVDRPTDQGVDHGQDLEAGQGQEVGLDQGHQHREEDRQDLEVVHLDQGPGHEVELLVQGPGPEAGLRDRDLGHGVDRGQDLDLLLAPEEEEAQDPETKVTKHSPKKTTLDRKLLFSEVVIDIIKSNIYKIVSSSASVHSQKFGMRDSLYFCHIITAYKLNRLQLIFSL